MREMRDWRWGAVRSIVLEGDLMVVGFGEGEKKGLCVAKFQGSNVRKFGTCTVQSISRFLK